MITEQQLLPADWNQLCQCIATQYGISMDTAALLILQAFGAACGDMIQIRTPDRIDLSPAFHCALVSNGIAFPRGAFTKLIEPLMMDSKITKEQRDENGIKAFKIQWEANLRERPDLAKAIQVADGELVATNDPERAVERIMAMSSNPFAMQRLRERRQQQIEEGGKRVAEIDDFIDHIAYYLCPDIIVNEPHWRDLHSLASGCFDQNVLALCFSTGPQEIQHLRPSERRHCADALTHAQRGKPGVTVITCADETSYADVLSQRALRKSGILNQFLLVEVGAGVEADPTPVDDQSVLEPFHAFLMKRFDQRVTGTKQNRRICFPDERGRKAHLDIRKWVFDEQKNCAPQIAQFMASLPDIALQLALGRAMMEGIAEGHFINGEFVERSVEFVKVLGRRQRILVDRLIMPQTDDEVWEAMIEKVIRRLEVRGPLTKRGLARTLHNQDYRQIEPALETAINLGRIEKRGDFYHARNVSVSASAQC